MTVWSHATGSLDIGTLQRHYAEGTLAPSDIIDAICQRIALRGDDSTWIHLASRESVLARCRELERAGRSMHPLWGIPFSVKDCNDVPGMPTTNALPETAYIAETTGQAISQLLDAGAICIGKTNMDQFGIGLVGMRTPYGACSNAFDERYISGGSSSGSAISVAASLVSFSIANDAAGSGRVPAAFNNIVGLKPTPGLVSNACVSGGGCVKTIETVSVFALTVEDALAVLRRIAGYDPTYPFSRPEADDVDLILRPPPRQFRFGVPSGDALRFFGDVDAEALFQAGLARLESIGGKRVEIDFAPFEETQRILYDGPWIAERALTLDPIVARYRDRLHPVTRTILESAKSYSAMDAFRAIHRVAELKCATRPTWDSIDVLVVPSTPTIYAKAEIAADPIALNSRLGIYTNFANLMGLCAVAVPNGFRPDGLPQGVTLLAPSWQEARISAVGAALHRASGLPLGATGNLPDPHSA